MSDGLYVPRRRVRVQIQLANGRTVAGEAYVAVHRGDGEREHLIDRLNDSSERFLPIAVEDRHLLVRKSAVVSVRTADASDTQLGSRSPGLRQIPVTVAMAVGPDVTGDLLAWPGRARDRALDNLNRLSSAFVALQQEDSITLVNTQHVIAVLERPVQNASPAREDGVAATAIR
jgi:hypothetical protein